MKCRLLLPALLLALALTACGQAAPPVDEVAAPVGAPTGAPVEPDEPQADPIRIELPADSFSLADTARIEYQIINDSGDTLSLSPIPLLETKTADGWQKVAFGDVGFCGTHDPLDASWNTALDLGWFDSLAPGEYRLTRSVYASDLSADGEPLAKPAALFTLTA